VLAAGGSTRLGHLKQLVVHEGEPLVRRAARAAVEVGAHPVVVVVGADAERVAPALSGVERATIVVRPGWRDGLASSLAAGLRAVTAIAPCDAVLVTVADQPLVDAAALARLLAAFGGERRIVAAAYGGTVGVPALFGAEHLDALARLTGDSGAGAWLRRRLADVTRVPLDVGALDVDTAADVERLRREDRAGDARPHA
jgi:CTP:molybdopterin cytidylyltransferase MocA